METIRISGKKVKITCTREDLFAYDLAVPVDIETADGKRRLRSLLRDACGFDPDSGRLFVQIYESAAGGCELFVTLTDNTIGGEGEKMPRQMTSAQVKTPAPPRRQTPTPTAYVFPDFGALLAVCERLLRSPGCCGGETSAYAGRGGGYYLLTYDAGKRLDIVCGEYGGERCPRGTEAYLYEHGALLCGGDAVEKLAELL